MLTDLLPPGATAHWWRGEPPKVDLLPAEAAVAGGYSARRRAEFAAVRWCARTAMARLGVPPEPIVPGSRGCPRWPAGIVGSMTHCAGLVIAMVARAGPLSSLGVDAEPHRSLPHEVLDLVLTGSERARLETLRTRLDGPHWDTVVFSAKESVYKAWYPLRRQWLDFADVEVELDTERGWYEARITRPAAQGAPPVVGQIRGRWTIRAGFVITTAAVFDRQEHPAVGTRGQPNWLPLATSGRIGARRCARAQERDRFSAVTVRSVPQAQPTEGSR